MIDPCLRILPLGQQTTSDDELLALKLNGEDNVIVDIAGVGSGQIEKHILGLFWLWNDGIKNRTGIQLVRFRVQRLGVQVFPALP